MVDGNDVVEGFILLYFSHSSTASTTEHIGPFRCAGNASSVGRSRCVLLILERVPRELLGHAVFASDTHTHIAVEV